MRNFIDKWKRYGWFSAVERSQFVLCSLALAVIYSWDEWGGAVFDFASGIQNFLRYKTGRNPAQEMPWEKFYALLERLEKKHKIKLRLSKKDFNVHKTRELPKPFKEGDVITATIKSVDRFPKSVIAVAGERMISVPGGEFKKDKRIRVKIVRDKHNIFVGKAL